MFNRCNRPLRPVIVVAHETTRETHGISTDLPLSIESARSVRDAAIAITYHGVSYLPIVDDGELVGLVALRGRGLRHDPERRPNTHPATGAVRAPGCISREP